MLVKLKGVTAKTKPSSGPLLQHVPHARRAVRLLAEDLLRVVGIEAPEVDQLAGAVDLGLEGVLALAEHGRRVEDLAVAAGQQLGGLQQDGRPVLERRGRPVLLGLLGGLDGQLDFFFAALVVLAQHVARACGA